jgi:hypothetical protein
LPIDIAYYIPQIQIQIAAAIKESETKLKENGELLDEDIINIVLRGAVGVILSAWSSWVFKSKSEDKNRQVESRDQATAVNKYIISFVRNSVNAGQRIGEGGGAPEGKRELVEIDYS